MVAAAAMTPRVFFMVDLSDDEERALVGAGVREII
jgi:hypothetical protein